MANNTYYRWVQRSVMEVGQNCRSYAPLRMKGMGCVRPALFTDKGVRKAGLADMVKKEFEAEGTLKIIGVYDKISPDPTGTEANECARWMRENAVDGIIAVGGGSVIDCMKAIKVMLGMKVTDVWDLIPNNIAVFEEPEAKHLGIPHISFPTTAGTGAEISPLLVITDEKAKAKKMMGHPFMGSDYAFLDPDLTVSLPPEMTALTGFDALSHAIEGLTAHGTNDMVIAFASKAIKLIRQNLPIVMENGKDIDARTRMLVAAHMGIVSICMAGLTVPVHNVAHAVGGVLHISHGEAINVTMPNVMDIFSEHYLQSAPALADAFELDPGMKPEEIVAASAQTLRDLQKVCGVKTKFNPVIDKTMVKKLCAAVESDATAAAYKMPPEIAKRCIEACFNLKE